jgi:hypothetical protein
MIAMILDKRNEVDHTVYRRLHSIVEYNQGQEKRVTA